MHSLEPSEMRFLVVYNGPLDPEGGSSGTVWQTNEALRSLGHEVDVVAQDDIRRIVSHSNLHYAFELPRRILEVTRDKLRKNRYDVILISQPYGYLVGKWLRGIPNAPLYLHRSHGHELAVSSRIDPWRDASPGVSRPGWRQAASRLLSVWLRRQARLALKYADGTIVPSTFDRDFLINQEGVDPRSVRSIYHAGVPSYLDSPLKPYTLERHRKLLYVGNFTRIKGAEILWEVGTRLLRRFPELALTLVTKRSDHARALSGFGKDIVGRVRLLDWVSQDTLMEIYDEHGLQIIPSLYEGASKAHYEGMSRGLCLVCSAVGAMCDSITGGQNGWLVSPGDSDGFVHTLSRLVGHYDVACAVAESARLRSFAFTWERTASQIAAYARELLSGRTRMVHVTT